jgi:hypothetical protein
MLSLQNKRNYIRRKKYLDESTAQIRSTLEFIAAVVGDSPNRCEIHKKAVVHAQAIEAACWSPRPRPTAELYQKLMAAKTAELCRALAKRALPAFDIGQLLKFATVKTATVPAAQPQAPVVTHDLDDGFSPNGDLPNVKLVWEDQGNIFGADFEVELLEISFSRISQQFEYKEVS